jgi:hypothetical protein
MDGAYSVKLVIKKFGFGCERSDRCFNREFDAIVQPCNLEITSKSSREKEKEQ